MDKQGIAGFVAYRLDFDHLLCHVHIIEDPKGVDTEFPFREPIGPQAFSMTRFVMRLMEELGFDGGDKVLLIVLAQLAEVLKGFWREDKTKHRAPGCRMMA